MKRKYVASFLFLIFSIIFVVFINTRAWMAGYSNRKLITVTDPAANYEILINVTYEASMQADFDDLRFINTGETTSYPYWIQEKVNSAWALVWVRMIDSGNFYMYYGNAGVGSESCGDCTFILWDDFETGVLNTTKWSSNTGVVITTVNPANGTYCAVIDQNDDTFNSPVSTKPIIIEAWMNMTYSASGGYDCYLGHANFIAWNNHREGAITAGKISYIDSSTHAYMVNDEHWQFYRIDINSSMSVFYVNNTMMGVFSGDTTMNSVGGYKGGSYGICTIDFIKVRHQVLPEPTYAFGEEETTTTTSTTSTTTTTTTSITTTLPYGNCDLCCEGHQWDVGECLDSPTCFGLNGSLDDCADPYCEEDYCCCYMTTTTTVPVTTTIEVTTTIDIYPEECPDGCSQIPIYPYGFESCELCIGNVTQLTNNCTLVCAPEDICSPNLYCLEFEAEFYCGCCCKTPVETTTSTSTSTTTTYPPFMNITSFPSCCMVSRSYCIDNSTIRQVWVVNNQSIQADAFCDNGCDTVLNECRKPQITEFIYYFLALVIIAIIIGIIMYLFRRF